MWTRLACICGSRSPTGISGGTNSTVRAMSSLPSLWRRAGEISLIGASLRSASVTFSVMRRSASLTWMKPVMLSIESGIDRNARVADFAEVCDHIAQTCARHRSPRYRRGAPSRPRRACRRAAARSAGWCARRAKNPGSRRRLRIRGLPRDHRASEAAGTKSALSRVNSDCPRAAAGAVGDGGSVRSAPSVSGCVLSLIAQSSA